MDRTCSWVIQSDFSNGPDYVVKVVFNDFFMDGGDYGGYSTNCTTRHRYRSPVDTLSFYDGMSPMSRHLGTYCDGKHPDVIYSTRQFLYVKFQTFYHYYGSESKFNISFIAVKKGTGKLLVALL